MAVLTSNQVTFSGALAELIGYSPRVIGAWCLAERSGASAKQWQAQGKNNWLNVEAFDSGWSAFSTDAQVWATPTRAAQATESWIHTKAAPSLRSMILGAAHKSDAEQIRAIWQSPWAGSHYNSGTILASTYRLVSSVQFPTGLQLKTSSQGGGNRTTQETRTLPYEFTRGTSDDPKEDSWDAIQRLAQEVKWHAWMRNGGLWYASDDYLVGQQPKYVIGEFAQGVDDLTFNVDTRGQTDDATFHCEANRYAVSPGDCVQLKHEGPADGKWIVYDVTRNAGSATAEVKIRRPVLKLDEPAPQTEQKTITTSANTGGTQVVPVGNAPQQFATLIAWAKKVSDAGSIYLWGGSHGSLKDVGPEGRFDCSSSVSYILYKAGFLPSGMALVSGALGSSWGIPGPGKYFTVWGSAGHAFLEFKTGPYKRFDTVGGAGPRVYTSMAPEPISGEGAWGQRHAFNF